MNVNTRTITPSRASAGCAAALTLAFAILGTASASAQTSVPTPRSVAPNYTPPQTVTPDYSASQKYAYIAPHAGTWDFYLMTGCWFFDNSTMNAMHVRVGERDYTNGKLRLNYDDAFFFGFGAGFNFTEQLSVHLQLAYASPDYDATFVANDGRVFDVMGEADISSGDIAVRYDLMRGKFRPFVQAAFGFMYIDTGLRNGPGYAYGYGYGWWDYYWPTVDHTYFTLGATAGARYDFTRHFFGQVSYTANWANTPHDWMLNQRVNISIGWNY